MISRDFEMNRRRGLLRSQMTKDIQLNCMPARDKKLAASVDSLDTHDSYSKRRDGGSQDSDFEWRSTPDVMSLKQSINFECSNSIPINFSEAWSYFQTCDLSAHTSNRIEDGKPSSGKIRSKFQGLVGNSLLNSALIPERDLIFAITACPMINELSVHRRILQSLYVFFTKKPTCPRFGSHWEEIGFQGQDPASDLRGVGMFGALQMLYLCSSQETKETLAPEVFELSRHPIHQFPLAVLSLNVTRMTLDAFRDGLLNKFCHKYGSAIMVVNQFYLAIMYRIFRKWRDKRMTIHDSCFLLKAVEKWCRAHPKKTFLRLQEYMEQFGVTGLIESNRKSKGKKKKLNHVNSESNLSWLDLTKPSLEVFI